MGLDFRQCDANWSYTGFSNFRRRLSAEIGMDLDSMQGFGGSVSWGSIKQDDIHPLLNHSDCDGVLTVEECKQVAPRLRVLVASWPENDYDKRQALILADGMDYCIKHNEPLVFC